MTIEFSIILTFILKHKPKWYYILFFYIIPLIIHYILGGLPNVVCLIYPFAFYITIPLIDQYVISEQTEKVIFDWKLFWKQILRLIIATFVSVTLQVMIYVIKAGYFSIENHRLTLSGYFIYSLEYDIALLVILLTISLYIDREKGDSTEWTTSQVHGGSSQTSKKQLQKSNLKKTLTKTQKRKIRLLYVKVYLTQLGGFALLMILPFVLGKVFEFLVMYLAFAITRYILGFNYSLHYKTESTCITVGVLVFGILSLAVPSFIIVLIIAITMGIGLAVLLHLSYKYKGLFLFAKIAKPDKFALLYTYFDGDLETRHVQMICNHKGLSSLQTDLICEFTQGNKISYMAYKHNYSRRMTIYKLDEAIKQLIN